MEDTFTLLPLHLDTQTKAISAPTLASSTALQAELEMLNSTHRALVTLAEGPHHAVPPPPVPLNPKRSAAIQKMREQGNAALSKRNTSGEQSTQHIHEAIKLYTYAIDMAAQRPAWEPSSIVRDELAILMSNRAQAHIGLQQWAEGAVDAETSVEMKAAPGQGKAWWRRGRCLLEMGRVREAREWIARALEIETGDGAADLRALKAECDEKWERERRKAGTGSAAVGGAGTELDK